MVALLPQTKGEKGLIGSSPVRETRGKDPTAWPRGWGSLRGSGPELWCQPAPAARLSPSLMWALLPRSWQRQTPPPAPPRAPYGKQPCPLLQTPLALAQSGPGCLLSSLPGWGNASPAGVPGEDKGSAASAPVPRGFCPALAGAAQDLNLGTPPAAQPHPLHRHERRGTELPSHPWHQARATAALRLWGLPSRTRRVMQHPELQGRACPRGSRSGQGKAAVSAPPAGRTRHFSGS